MSFFTNIRKDKKKVQNSMNIYKQYIHILIDFVN